MSKASTPSDDIDALLATPERPGAKECHACWALTRIDPHDADRLAAVLARRDIPPAKIQPLFAARLDGWSPGDTTIQRHRDGKCQKS